MKFPLNAQVRHKKEEDPFLEKMTNSLIIAFVGAAVIKILYFLYTHVWPAGSDSGSAADL